MSYGSPYHSGSTPQPAEYYYSGSPSPTPSPRHPYSYYDQPTQRPQTRAHFRHASSGAPNDFRAPPPSPFSPRYTSKGEYATGPGPKVSSRKHSFSKGSHHSPKRERSNSYTYYRASYGDSDEDEVFEVDGVTYVLPAHSRSRRHYDYYTAAAGHGTDYYYYKQGPGYDRERTAYYEDPIQQRSATRVSHTRRPSGSVPIHRPSTARPSSSHQKKAVPSTPVKATEADAKKHKIPPGYSLKNWDPTEEPLMLLGSVFDANSLGKWIYDWTVYHRGPGTPIAEMAGELWLLLIQLSGKVKRSEECVSNVRRMENREMMEDFIASGERLLDKLRLLLKKCEAPMLKASKRKDAPQLSKNSGTEFVDTLFGRERELEKTERFMQSVRLWNLRFDANCDEILKHPTA